MVHTLAILDTNVSVQLTAHPGLVAQSVLYMSFSLVYKTPKIAVVNRHSEWSGCLRCAGSDFVSMKELT